jgi:hypothetical protein
LIAPVSQAELPLLMRALFVEATIQYALTVMACQTGQLSWIGATRAMLMQATIVHETAKECGVVERP